jgi:hypothetical protein
VAVAIALLAVGAVDAGAGGRSQPARRADAGAPVTARAARTAIRRALRDRPEPGLRADDLGRVRVVGTYKKGEGKGVANSTGFVAETTIVAAEFVSPGLPLGRAVKTFAIAPAIGAVDVFAGHPRWHLTLAAARDAAVERAQRDHGPSAFAWPVSVSRSGKSIIFESIDHAGRRDRYLVRVTKKGNRVAVQRAVLPPLDSGP